MQDTKWLVWFFLAITGVLAVDVGRVKREDNDGADMLDKAKEMAENMQDDVKTMAGGVQQTAEDMAKQILDNSGLDVKDLPQDLMQPASTLFQLRTTDTFQNILKSVKEKMNTDVELGTLQSNFEKLLTNVDFMKEVKQLMADNNGDMENPNFKTEMEKVMQTYLEDMRDTAATVSVSLASVLLVSVVHFVL